MLSWQWGVRSCLPYIMELKEAVITDKKVARAVNYVCERIYADPIPFSLLIDDIYGDELCINDPS